MSSTRGSPRIVLIAAAILFLAGGQAGAEILFSTFGPGDSYDTSLGWTIGSPAVGGAPFTQGDQFSFARSQAYSLDSIRLAAGLIHGTNQLDVFLMTDAAGQPGSPLESWSFINQMGPFLSLNPLLVGTSVSHPLLTPGTHYWLIASASGATSAAWNWSLPPVAGLHAEITTIDTSWSIFNTDHVGAFDINGTVVPLPGALLLGLLGLGYAGIRLRRERI